MKTSGIMEALPAQNPGLAKSFYLEKVGLQALESDFLKAGHEGWAWRWEMVSTSCPSIPPGSGLQASSRKPSST